MIAIGSGLYPLLYRYSRNFSLVNSVSHLLFFLTVFIAIPIIVFNISHWLLKKLKLDRFSLGVLALFNVFLFLFFIKTIHYFGLHPKKTVLVIVLAILFSVFLKKHLKKIVILQYILAFIGILNLGYIIYETFKISDTWQQQPDTIVEANFKKKPNVYFIEPDGYVNFSEIDKGYYNFDNSSFKSFLDENKFTTYPNFRSNYSTTLSSNSSVFMMKHHFYNNKVTSFEMFNARDMIVSENPILNIFKNNGYKTYFLTETRYLLFNRPQMGFDYCNIDYADIPYLNIGITEPQAINAELKTAIDRQTNAPKFFFLQILKPWHIGVRASKTSNKEIEKQKWLESLDEANRKLTEVIKVIKQKDPDALILIMSDHGGFVGMDYGDQSEEKSQDRDFIYSIFSSQLAIHWPHNEKPMFNDKFKSSVNTFRLLFSYLSEDETFLKNLQPDESYMVLRKGTEPGVYKYIGQNGEITFEKYLEN
ncbi:sulfatase-like hydrolase/transferase [Winogradskyella sp. PG-2]|uniref:sulfatase-like hydrolase/transferase n=1 Tax=Winogradskyella sp. PG-2 TaxID=754409 RepID=UPI0014950174|nr:sulfatase-like hydrolase/transferase [Winogradskyella sp. PG-2]